MRKNLIIFLMLFAFLSTTSAFACKETPVFYTIDLNGPSTATFFDALQLKGLKVENDIYQYASTPKGTYQMMEIGRLVSNFKAFDTKGNEIPTENIKVNL